MTFALARTIASRLTNDINSDDLRPSSAVAKVNCEAIAGDAWPSLSGGSTAQMWIVMGKRRCVMDSLKPLSGWTGQQTVAGLPVALISPGVLAKTRAESTTTLHENRYFAA